MFPQIFFFTVIYGIVRSLVKTCSGSCACCVNFGWLRLIFRSRGSSPNVSNVHRGYSCGSCDVVAPTRPALRKHIVDCHPPVSSTEPGETKTCPSSGCDFTTSSRCEMETHVAAHVAQGMTPTGKKRTLALQRVRYRYLRFFLQLSIGTDSYFAEEDCVYSVLWFLRARGLFLHLSNTKSSVDKRDSR